MTYALIPGAGGSAWYWHRVNTSLLPGAIAISRVPTASIVLVNPMVPVAGETPGQSWAATGHDQVFTELDPVEDFFHDVPGRCGRRRYDRVSHGSPTRRSGSRGLGPSPASGRCPQADVPTRVIQVSDDRLFPLEFQRRVVRSRLGLELEVMPGGHLMALSQPVELASRIRSASAGTGNIDGH